MENINDFTMPLHIEDDNNYIKCIKEKVNYFVNNFEKLTNINRLNNYKLELTDSINYIKESMDDIEKIINYLLSGKDSMAYEKMSYILGGVSDVIITDLNKSNAFLGNKLYSDLNRKLDEIFLFRGRTCEPYETYDAVEMLHIPLDNRKIVGSYRYSIPGVPCLYLASNSYIVWKELRCPDLNKLTISSIKIDDPELLLNKIIDLTLPIETYYNILNDEQLHIENNKEACDYIIRCMRTVPLIIASSVTLEENSKRDFKIEYLFPQLISRYMADNLFAIAYRSNRINGFDISASNLAIPIVNFENNKKYGNIINQIQVSDSLNIGYFNDFIINNNTKQCVNKQANGPSAKKLNNSFKSSLVDPTSTFNIINKGSFFSYDGFVNYNSSIFYQFDEYLLFYNDFKSFDDL